MDNNKQLKNIQPQTKNPHNTLKNNKVNKKALNGINSTMLNGGQFTIVINVFI